MKWQCHLGEFFHDKERERRKNKTARNEPVLSDGKRKFVFFKL